MSFKTRTLDRRSLEDYLVKMGFLGYKLRSIDKEVVIKDRPLPIKRKNGKTMAQYYSTIKHVFIVKHYEK